MLNENIRAVRKSKGLSQEALAIRLNVVRQTISKWEKGLSVPDADLLIALSEALETPVSALLGETMAEPEEDGLRAICEKLEEINLRFAREKARRRKAPSLDSDRAVRGHRDCVCGADRGGKPLPGLGLRRA